MGHYFFDTQYIAYTVYCLHCILPTLPDPQPRDFICSFSTTLLRAWQNKCRVQRPFGPRTTFAHTQHTFISLTHTLSLSYTQFFLFWSGRLKSFRVGHTFNKCRYRGHFVLGHTHQTHSTFYRRSISMLS